MQPQASRWRLGQMVNVPALLHLGACMRHPSLLAPHVNAGKNILIEIICRAMPIMRLVSS